MMSHWRVEDLTRWSLHDVPRLREKDLTKSPQTKRYSDCKEDTLVYKTKDTSFTVDEDEAVEIEQDENSVPTIKSLEAKPISHSIFPVNRTLNDCICLFQGHQLGLDVDSCATTAVCINDADVQDAKLHVQPSLVRLLDVIRHRRIAAETEDQGYDCKYSNTSCGNTQYSGVIHINTASTASGIGATAMQKIIPGRILMHGAAPRYVDDT